jgi:prepilin-type N-terminal cleavage/methylation domain-containing protein
MKKKGFSLLELLFVMGLVSLVGAMGVGVYGQVRRNEDMAAAVMQAVHLLNTARVKSVAGEGDMTWKVRLETDRVKLQDEAGVTVEEYRLPVKYNLFGPITELEFSRADGRVEMCETGCAFELRETRGSLSYQFKVLFSGVVEY